MPAQEEMNEWRKSDGSDGDDSGMSKQARTRYQKQVNAAALDRHPQTRPEKRCSQKPKSRQRDKKRADLWSLEIGQARVRGQVRDLRLPGRDGERKEILNLDVAVAVRLPRCGEVGDADSPQANCKHHGPGAKAARGVSNSAAETSRGANRRK